MDDSLSQLSATSSSGTLLKHEAKDTSNLTIETESSESQHGSSMIHNDSFYDGITFPCVFSDQILYEYEWPVSSKETYMLMENVSDYLGVRNLTRKYPTLSKRFVSGEELNHLINIGIIDKSLRDISLTALVAKEVLALMSAEYPDRFLEYQKFITEKHRQEFAAKQLEYQAIKADSSKYAELRERVMHSVAEWNAELCRERNRGKRCFFDIQTMVVQRPRPPIVCVENPPVDPYPTALIAGQFSSFYRKYCTDELFALPVNTVINTDRYFPNPASQSPPPIAVHPSELQPDPKDEAAPPSLKLYGSRNKIRKVSSSSDVGAEDTRGEEIGEYCAFCRKDLYGTDRYVQCSKCGSCGHPVCLQMSEELYDTVKTYDWMCMECKPCSVCSQLDEEDKMLFCDKCDRGYHTFCVGLSELPSGRWVCPNYCLGGAGQQTSQSRIQQAPAACDLSRQKSLPKHCQSMPDLRYISPDGTQATNSPSKPVATSFLGVRTRSRH